MKGLYNWLGRINEILWSRAVAATLLSIQSVCAFRIITGIILLVVYHPTFSWIEHTPRAFYNPPFLSFAYFTTGFPGKHFFQVVDLIILFLNVLILIGCKAKIATLLYVFLSLIGFTYQYSFGKIDHNILLYVMLFCMAFSGWGTRMSVLPDKSPPPGSPARSLSLLSILICFAFFTAGFGKALYWIDFNTHSNGFASWYYYNLYGAGRNYLLSPFVKKVPFALLEPIDYLTCLFELSPFFFLMASGKAWRYWLIVACLFHLITTLVLNIGFTWNFIVYLSFVDFSGLDNKRKPNTFKIFSIVTIAFLAVVILVRLNDIVHYQLSDTVFIPNYFFESTLFVAMISWIVTGVIIIRDASRVYSSKTFGLTGLRQNNYSNL